MEPVSVTPAQVQLRLSRGAQIVFVDARRRDFDDYHVRLPGALHVPALEAAQSLHLIPRNFPIVAYCT